MRVSLSILAFLVAATSANAACIGTGALRTCYDDSGNSYVIQDFGNTTITNGHNAQTGSSWSQNSTTFGNMTVNNGVAADGNSWNSTQTNFGDTTTINGSDSQGNLFSKTCTQFGCY